jgi:hypothetical protein
MALATTQRHTCPLMPAHWHQSLPLSQHCASSSAASGPSRHPRQTKRLACHQLLVSVLFCVRAWTIAALSMTFRFAFLGCSSLLTAAVRGSAYPARLLRIAVHLLARSPGTFNCGSLNLLLCICLSVPYSPSPAAFFASALAFPLPPSTDFLFPTPYAGVYFRKHALPRHASFFWLPLRPLFYFRSPLHGPLPAHGTAAPRTVGRSAPKDNSWAHDRSPLILAASQKQHDQSTLVDWVRCPQPLC